MRHDPSIPLDLHTQAGASVKEALGLFWSSLFRDRELVEAEIAARVLSACQAYIDAMEALSLRDHTSMPVFHREHWHPALIRLSERNTGCGLAIGMDGDPKIGPQREGTVFTVGETFVVGGNAEYSKVYTYPLDAETGKRLVSVGTCLCDSIVAPDHILSQGRDFMVRDGVLLIRKEHDPFTVDGYRIVEDGDDSIAVLWLCDAEFDREHVGDFLAYPLGFDVKSTPSAAKMLSALWDVVVYGLTPLHLNMLLGALFDVPTVPRSTVVESIEYSGSDATVTTSDDVYRIERSRVEGSVAVGDALPAGSFLTGEITVYHGLSEGEVDDLVDRGVITSLTLPPGSVAGVDVGVDVENIVSPLEVGDSGSYEWFKLSAADSRGSPFWQAVFGRTTAAQRIALCNPIAQNLFDITAFAGHMYAPFAHNGDGSVSVDIAGGSITVSRTSADQSGAVFTAYGSSSVEYSVHATAGHIYRLSVSVSGDSYPVRAYLTFWPARGGRLDRKFVEIRPPAGSGSVMAKAPESTVAVSVFFYANCSTVGGYATLSDIVVQDVSVNPLRHLGYVALANTVLVHTTRGFVGDQCAQHVFAMLRRLMPDTGSLLVVQTGAPAGSVSMLSAAGCEEPDEPGQDGSSVAMDDDVEYSLKPSRSMESVVDAAEDSVAVRFIPDAGVEV